MVRSPTLLPQEDTRWWQQGGMAWKTWQNRKRLNMTWAVTCYDELAKVNAKVNDSQCMSQWAFVAFCARWRSRYWNPIHFWRPLATLEPSGAFWRLPSQTPSLESLESWESLWKREQKMETCEPQWTPDHPHCNTLPKLRCILSALHIFASCESMALAYLLARNDNSSRFGKFIELQFRTSGKVRQMEKHGACFGDLGRICGAQ